MEKQKAYANLAKWFEYLNDDCDYENWSQYLIMKLKRFPLQTGLDVGCGGGWFTRAFKRAGYETTGMDASAEMLDCAQENALKDGVRGEYVLGDITKKKPQKKFDFVTAINDCVNYIPKDKLQTAFKNVASGLKRGGIFLFDVSSKRKFEEKLNNTVSVDDRDDVTYISFNSLLGDKATLDVTLFVKGANGGYTRLDERHVQYVYTEKEIIDALQINGFTVLEVEGHLGLDKESADRICFLAQKGEV